MFVHSKNVGIAFTAFFFWNIDIFVENLVSKQLSDDISLQKKFLEGEESRVLALLWLYASWLDEKKIAIPKKAPKSTSWIENFVQLLDEVKSRSEVSLGNPYF